MSLLIQIVKINNPFYPARDYDILKGVGGTVSEVLDSIGMSEFETPTIMTVNNEPVLQTEWQDPLKEGDIVGMVPVVQGSGVILIITALFYIAAIAIALTLSVPVPNSPKLADPDPVYSLRGQTNQTKLGHPIEAGYGRLRLWPSYGAKPYSKYISNESYQYSLFCIGHGEYQIDQVYIEDTPIEDFEDIEVRIYQPGESVTLFRDNIQTSSEVGSQELYGPNEDNYDSWFTAVANDSGTLTDLIELDVALPQGLYRQSKKGNLKNVNVTAEFEYIEINDVGDEIGVWTELRIWSKTKATVTPKRYTLTQPVPRGRYKVRGRRTNGASNSHTVGDTLVWESMRAFLPNVGTYGEVTMLAMKARATANLNDQSKRKINCDVVRKLPIWTHGQAATDEYYIQLVNVTDRITLHNGSTVMGVGEIFYLKLQVRGEAGTRIAPAVESVTASHVGAVVQYIQETGVWETTVHKISLTAPEEGAGIFTNIHVAAVGNVLDADIRDIEFTEANGTVIDHWALDNWVPGDLNGLVVTSDSGTRDGVYIDCVGVGHPATPDGWSEPVATRSLVYAFMSVFTSAYGANLTSSIFNLPAMTALDAEFNSEGIYFDWVFDSKTTVWEAAKTVCQAGRAMPILDGSQVYIVRDVPRSTVHHLFNNENIVQDSFELNVSLLRVEEYDSIEMEYRDPVTWKPETVICALPGSNADKPESLNIAGIADRDRAYHEAMYMLSVKKFQRQEVRFSTGVEGFIATYGDFIKVEFDTFGVEDAVGGHITGVSTDRLTVELTVPVSFSDGFDYRLSAKGRDGTIYGPYTATEGAYPDQVILDAPITTELNFDNHAEPPIFIFGRSVSFAQDCVITNLSPGGDETVDVTAILYDLRVYDYDNTDAPPLDYAGSQFPSDPLPVVTGVKLEAVSENGYKISWVGSDQAQNYIVQISEDPTEFDPTENDPNEAWETIGQTTATFFETTILLDYVYIRVAGVNVGQGPWSYYEQLIAGDSFVTETTDSESLFTLTTEDGITLTTHLEE